MYRIRIPIGLLLLAVIAGLCYLDSCTNSCYATGSVIILVITAALWEFYAMLKCRDMASYSAYGLVMVFIGLILHILLWNKIIQLSWISCYEVLIMILCFMGAMVYAKDEVILETIAATFLGIIYIYFPLKYLLRIRCLGEDGLIYLLLLILVAKSMDIGGYMIGKVMGKHKICPSISPKKSWEGFFGGLVLSILVGIGLVSSFPALKKIFTLSHIIIFAIIISVLSFFGDLSESLVKRKCGVKDSSSLIPEFGGMMDLIDSLIFVTPCCYYFLVFVRA